MMYIFRISATISVTIIGVYFDKTRKKSCRRYQSAGKMSVCSFQEMFSRKISKVESKFELRFCTDNIKKENERERYTKKT